jgi:hypothetical protein
MANDTVPSILRTIMENANRPRSKKEDEAARLFVLGTATIADYLSAMHESNRK